MNFTNLIQSIRQTQAALQQDSFRAINRSLTMRNWLIGFYIVEFEQQGEDRAKYGDKLLPKLSKTLNIRGLAETNLKVCRQFYQVYPQVGELILDLKQGSKTQITQFVGSTDEFQLNENHRFKIETLVDKSENKRAYSANRLVSRLSFTHLVQMLSINDPAKRFFYEMECMKGNWNVAELKRQVNSLYYERSSLSQFPEKLSAIIEGKAEQLKPADIIKSMYTFEFLELNAKEVIEESDLETALLDQLQQFLLELGHGFCLEARQKRILIGDEYFFIDLVFYHRILKCHVLADLKIEAFTHSNAGQLNTYLNYYKAEEMVPDDNPPVGILLVTDKNSALVQYATAGMDQRLFVSKYLIQLPGKQQLENFIQNELKQLS